MLNNCFVFSRGWGLSNRRGEGRGEGIFAPLFLDLRSEGSAEDAVFVSIGI